MYTGTVMYVFLNFHLLTRLRLPRMQACLVLHKVSLQCSVAWIYQANYAWTFLPLNITFQVLWFTDFKAKTRVYLANFQTQYLCLKEPHRNKKLLIWTEIIAKPWLKKCDHYTSLLDCIFLNNRLLDFKQLVSITARFL